MKWEMLSILLQEVMVALTMEWGCSPLSKEAPPPADAAFEPEVDAWCRRLARDVTSPLPAPLRAQPWILVRLSAAAAYTQALGLNGVPPPAGVTPALLEELLVSEWHARLHQLWKDGDLSFPA